MSWLSNGRERGPFCVKCTGTPLAQMKLLEAKGTEVHKEYMEWVLDARDPSEIR